MYLGGVMLAAGTILHLRHEDYLGGTNCITFMLGQVVEVLEDSGSCWVVLEGCERPTDVTPWRTRRLQVRIDALKRSLTQLA